MRPRRWSRIGELRDVPVFHPLFWGRVTTKENAWELHIERLRQGPIKVSELLIDAAVNLHWQGEQVDIKSTNSNGRRWDLA